MMTVFTGSQYKQFARSFMSLVVAIALSLTGLQGTEFTLSDDKPLFTVKPTEATQTSKPLAPVDTERRAIGEFGGNVQSGVHGKLFISDLDLLTGTATLIARFEPPEGYYLYSKSLPMTGLNGVGRPTLLEIADDQPDLSNGPLLASQQARDMRSQGAIYPLYPTGPVEIHLPIQLPAGSNDRTQAVRLWLTYMTCNEEFCLRPVEREEVTVELPTSSAGLAGTWPEPHEQGDTEETPSLLDILEYSTEDLEDIQLGEWYYPKNVSELQAILDAAEEAELPAFLDFTGPSCLNCQIMKQTIYVLPEVQTAFNSLVLISINTDPPYADLADFQLATYGTFTRPFYVRTQPSEVGQSWSTFFRPGNKQEFERFVKYLGGDEGDGLATADGHQDSIEQSGGWGGFLLLAIFGGLFTLVMPCTYPMIPLTINFFAKQGENGKRTWPLAATYALGIIAFFELVGFVFALIMGDNPAYFAGHWLTNLIIGCVFLLLGASLIGLFFLRLPSGMMNIGGGRSGYGGALLMGLAFAVMSFTCTAPFAGLVLGTAALSGSWTTAIIGMAVYASVIALPFFFLALAPKLLNRLPGAGSWMNEFKVVGGFVEIAASLKFLYMTDFYFGWGLIDRTTVLAAWTAIGLFIAVYMLGFIRLKGDSPVENISPGRLLGALGFAILGFFFLAGLTGTHLGALEGLFP